MTSAPMVQNSLHMCLWNTDPRFGRSGLRIVDFTPIGATRALQRYCRINFESGIEKTVHWYVNEQAWWRAILDRGYAARRIGLV
jgi:hypothetical protein